MLDAWTASPARFREDANSEDDARVGDVVYELAQNAADAGDRLLLTVRDGVLYAANTGRPLDAAGVEALSHLRASAKGAGSVGRFGVGFKAVLSVTDEPSILSETGGVRWSRAETLAVVREIPELAGELERRGREVPVMRLPFPAEPDPFAASLLADLWTTVVRLPLSTSVTVDIDESLLLVFPSLREVVLDDRVLAVDESRWTVVRRSGEVPEGLLADRPVEERERPGWSVVWAAGPVPDDRLRAPQPTEERIALPALLCATFPLDPNRRHVAQGPLASWLAERAAEAYAELLASDPLGLMPSTLPAGPVDLAIREALDLPRAPVVPTAADPERRLRGEDAVALDLGAASGAVTALLAGRVGGLAPPEYARARALGVRPLRTSEVVELLAGVDAPPEWWRELYAAIGEAPDRDALRALPVPLADGSRAFGPPGLLLGDPRFPGLRWVHPDAAHDLLLTLGAVRPDPGELLDAVRDRVEDSLDEPDDELRDAVLALLRDQPSLGEQRPWLAELALPARDGEEQPAGELLLGAEHGGRLAGVVEGPFGIVADALVEEFGADALVACGVLRTFAVVRDEDVTSAEHFLDAEDEWLATQQLPVRELVAVRDLELVVDWAAARRLLAELPVTGYTSWWLARNPTAPATDGGVYLPSDVCAPDAPHWLRALYPVAAVPVDGAARDVEDLDAPGLAGLVRRLGERGPALGEPAVRRLYAVAAELLALDDVRLDPPPERFAAVRDGELVSVADPVVVDAPDLVPLLGDVAVLPASLGDGRLLHDVLGVPLASGLARFAVRSTPRERVAWEDVGALADLLRLADDEAMLRSILGPSYAVHDELLVNDAHARPVRVSWRYQDAVVHVDAAGGPLALSRGIAHALGLWSRRDTIAVFLAADDEERAHLLREALLDPVVDPFDED